MVKMTLDMMVGWADDYEEDLYIDGFINWDSKEKMESRLQDKIKSSKILSKHFDTSLGDVEEWLCEVDSDYYWNNIEIMERELYRLIIDVAEELDIDLFKQLKDYYYENDGAEGFEERYGNLQERN